MKRKAFGAIDLLIGLVITTVLFMIMIPTMKNVGGMKFKGTSVNQKSVEQQVDETVNEVEALRRQSIDAQTKIQEEN